MRRQKYWYHSKHASYSVFITRLDYYHRLNDWDSTGQLEAYFEHGREKSLSSNMLYTAAESINNELCDI